MSKPSTAATFLAKKGAQIATQDREWAAALPHGWWHWQVAQEVWGVAPSTAQHRLALLRTSGVCIHRGSSWRGRWCVARRNG